MELQKISNDLFESHSNYNLSLLLPVILDEILTSK